jgi:hypothetical protein
MAACGITMLEAGTICLYDSEGRMWFNRIDETQRSIDESQSLESRCEIVKIKQTEITAVDSLKEDALYLNVLQHSEKQELLRDRNF